MIITSLPGNKALVFDVICFMLRFRHEVRHNVLCADHLLLPVNDLVAVTISSVGFS
jgi:hypothetical protein